MITEQTRHLRARSPQYALLGFLYEQPSHGYELHQQLVSELGYVWHTRQSQTYAILKRLAAQGFIRSTTLEQEKLPPRQLLQITASGRHQFEQWIQTPSISSVHTIRLEFITRLYFARRLFPDLIPRIIEDELANINTTITRLEKDRNVIPPEQTFNRLSQELRIRQLHSVRDWLIDCRVSLEIEVQI